MKWKESSEEEEGDDDSEMQRKAEAEKLWLKKQIEKDQRETEELEWKVK